MSDVKKPEVPKADSVGDVKPTDSHMTGEPEVKPTDSHMTDEPEITTLDSHMTGGDAR
uniref:Sigma-like protein n=1 Tax=Streptomyces sp. NBC_01401 TaxID=2903854 RepID=A0AAU3GUN0_9ACTN